MKMNKIAKNVSVAVAAAGALIGTAYVSFKAGALATLVIHSLGMAYKSSDEFKDDQISEKWLSAIAEMGDTLDVGNSIINGLSVKDIIISIKK